MKLRERVIFTLLDIFTQDFSKKLTETISCTTDNLFRQKQLDKFNEIYKYSILNVGYYREKYTKSHLSVKSLKNLLDIEKIPYITKEEVLSGNVIAKRSHSIIALASGGTCGKEVYTHIDKNYLLKRYSMLLYILYSLGWRLGDSTLALHPVEYGYFNNLFNMIKKAKINKIIFEFLQQYVVYGIFHNRRNIYYSSDIFETNYAEKFFAKVFNRSPMLLLARPDVINTLVKQAKMKMLDLGGIDKIITVGNILTDSTKMDLEDIFNSKVYNMYASTELGYVGISCNYSGCYVHVDESNYFLEIDRNNDNEIVITDFNNCTMPLIRYRTSDIGELRESSCSCGRKGLMLRVIGRRGRFLLNNDGRRIYEAEILNFLGKYPMIWACQLKREANNKIRALIRPRDTKRIYAEQTFDDFSESFNIDRDSILFDFDASLVTSNSGKFCIII